MIVKIVLRHEASAVRLGSAVGITRPTVELKYARLFVVASRSSFTAGFIYWRMDGERQKSYLDVIAFLCFFFVRIVHV